jgi:hypothetical protein
MIRAKVSPRETLILEDSDIGRRSAMNSGGHLCPIKDPQDVTLDKILYYIERAEKENSQIVPELATSCTELNIVIPCAGKNYAFNINS